MQARQPSTRPAAAAPGAASQSAKRAGVVLVTRDASLIAPFTAVPGAQRARPFETITALLNAWPRNRAAVVVLDARSAGDLAGDLESLGAHNVAMVAIALVDEANRVAAAALERQRRLFDHLLLPLDAGTAKTVLEHATEEAAARLALAAGERTQAVAAPPVAPPAPAPTAALATVEPPRRRRRSTVAPAAAAAARASAPRSRGSAKLVGLAALLALSLALAIGWFLLHRTSTPAPAPAAAPAAAAAPAQPAPSTAPAVATASAAVARASVDEQVDALLDRARGAMRERRYIDPAEDNALAHYKAVLALDPSNGEARQGLDRIAELLLMRAASALAVRDNAAALRSLEAARAIAPSHPRLATLDTQVNARATELSAGQVQAAMQAGAFARATTLLTQAERTGAINAAEIATLRQEITRRSAAAQLTDLSRLVQTRISQGQLLEPSGDNAKAYLATLQERGGAAVADEVARLTELYQKRTMTEARAAMAVGAWTQADAWLAELRSTRGGAALAQPLQKELERRTTDARAPDAARAAPAPAQPDAATPATPASTAAAGAPTPAASPPAAGAAPAAILTPAHLAKPLKVDYPRAAAVRNASGWVTVEADVDANGRVSAVRVLDADPRGLFENAARNAVQQASFVAATATDGSHPKSTVSMRVRFQLDDRS